MNRLNRFEHPSKFVAAIVSLLLVTGLTVNWSASAAEKSRQMIEYKARATLKESEGGAEIQIAVRGNTVDELRGFVTVKMGGRKLRERIVTSEQAVGRLFLGSNANLNIEIEIFPTTSILLHKTFDNGTTIVLEYTDPKTNKWFHYLAVENDKTKSIVN